MTPKAATKFIEWATRNGFATTTETLTLGGKAVFIVRILVPKSASSYEISWSGGVLDPFYRCDPRVRSIETFKRYLTVGLPILGNSRGNCARPIGKR